MRQCGPRNEVREWSKRVPLLHPSRRMSMGTMNATSCSRPFVKSTTIPFDNLTLCYALSDICKLKPLKYFPRRPPRWREMEVRDTIPPSENASRRAYETHCIKQERREKATTVQAQVANGGVRFVQQGPARTQGPNREPGTVVGSISGGCASRDRAT